MENDYMLTTVDNPYNPFDQFTQWLLFDKEKGYNTCEYLARIVNLSDDLSEKESNEAIEIPTDEIIKFDPLNIYKKVTSKSFETAQESTNT